MTNEQRPPEALRAVHRGLLPALLALDTTAALFDPTGEMARP